MLSSFSDVNPEHGEQPAFSSCSSAIVLPASLKSYPTFRLYPSLLRIIWKCSNDVSGKYMHPVVPLVLWQQGKSLFLLSSSYAKGMETDRSLEGQS